MSGIRLQPGAPRHYGGSNRTIIKQAYEMLVSERTALARKPVGTLVTLDKVFELVEGNLSNEKRTDIHEIGRAIQGRCRGPRLGAAGRQGRSACWNSSATCPARRPTSPPSWSTEVGQAPRSTQVKAAVKRLQDAQFIRNTEEGWKLQTAQEKNWETERRGHLEPKPRERNEIIRQALEEIFGEPALKTYRHQELRTFRIGIRSTARRSRDEGELPLTLCVADDADDLPASIDEIRDESHQNSHEGDLYWLFGLTPEIDELVAQLHASRKMVEKYNQLSAQHKISPDEATCLQDEKNAKSSATRPACGTS